MGRKVSVDATGALRRRHSTIAVLVALVGIGIWAAANARPDCPGKIVCPITGEVICADQCPLQD